MQFVGRARHIVKTATRDNNNYDCGLMYISNVVNYWSTSFFSFIYILNNFNPLVFVE